MTHTEKFHCEACQSEAETGFLKRNIPYALGWLRHIQKKIQLLETESSGVEKLKMSIDLFFRTLEHEVKNNHVYTLGYRRGYLAQIENNGKNSALLSEINRIAMRDGNIEIELICKRGIFGHQGGQSACEILSEDNA